MLGEQLSRIPLVRSLVAPVRRRRARRRFVEQYGTFYGVYPSFERARADAPHDRPFGYDQPAAVTDYERLLDEQLARPLESYEVPVLAILSGMLAANPALRVVDVGGNLGTHYFAYRTRTTFTHALRWTVVDVPSIVRRGPEIAAARAADGLQFTTTLDEALPADVLLASGSMHNMEDPYRILRTDAPAHVILNRLPLGAAPSFVTLQNGGAVYYPQWVLERAELLGVAHNSGYGVVQEWVDAVDSCSIPFHPELGIRAYAGMHLVRISRGGLSSAAAPP